MAYTTIDKPSNYFNTVIYSGSSSNQTISGVGFQSDMTWFKNRNNTANHALQNSVVGAGKRLSPDRNVAEGDEPNGLGAWNSDGFTFQGDYSGSGYNASGRTYVAWSWKKVAGVFDIQTYTGNNTGSRQVSHNLGVVPSLIIIKNRTNASSWWIGSTEISFTWNADYLQLNESAAKGTDGGGHIFGAVPTSSYFVPGDNNDTNGNSNNYVAYLFGNKQGVSKVGSYTGNGNANGTFVYTGFKPAFFMAKRTDASDMPWVMIDNKRNSFNALSNTLLANSNEAANTGTDRADFLSQGVKIRTNSTAWNASGASFIYMAFAENPFVTSSGVPACAR